MVRVRTVTWCLVAFLAGGLVAAQEADLAIPHPRQLLGFEPGAERQLMDYGQLVDVMQRLAETSPRIELRAVGESPLGRTMYVAFISSPANLARLDELQRINRRLAIEPDLAADERERLVNDGRVFVMETLSMHSGEVGPSQALPLFAYRMATADEPEVVEALDNVVQMFVLCHNPDGMDMVVEHYRRYLGTPYEGSSLPGVYHRYVGHDNNRDFVALTQEDTRVISRLYSTEWYPQVLVEKHQMGSTGPRYFVPPNHDPIAQVIDEGLWNWSAVFGAELRRDMADDGLQGVASNWLFDNYWPGSTETSHWKNVISFLTEAASCRLATPVFVEPTELAVRGKGLAEYKKGANMTDPWPGGRWALSDIVTYELSAMSSILSTASRHRRAILAYRNDLCREEVAKGRSQPPFYFVLPSRQHDFGAVIELAELLDEHGISLYRLGGPVTIGETALSEGDIVVPLSQPYRPFIKEVMERQRYPERHYTPGGELIRPYDITSWSLPLHMGVRVLEIDTRSAELEDRLQPLRASALRPAVEVPGGAWAIAYPSTSNQAYRAAFTALGHGMEVRRLVGSFGPAGDHLPAGSFLILTRGASAAAVEEVVASSLIEPHIFDSDITVPMWTVRRPRVALVETWFHDMDAGWTRYLFDSYGVAYTVLHPEDVETAGLARNFDVVVFPAANHEVLTHGRFKRGDRYVANDFPPDYRQPISKGGLAQLTEFIQGGGVVVSWGGSTELFTDGLAAATEGGDDNGDRVELPVRDVTEGAEDEGLMVPGAFLAVEFLEGHPVTIGMPRHGGGFSRGRPVLATSVPSLDTDRRVVAVHPDRELLLSGYLEGEKALRNRPAAVWVRAGEGQIVLFGFRPQFRGSTPATFKLVFNSLLLPPLGDSS